MAQEFVTDAGTLVIPGAYPSQKVETTASGIATNGVLMIIGEADAGPDFTLEEDIGLNSFGPDQLADVKAKYKSGNLVDAFRSATAPMNDPDIQGTFNRAVLLKTNPSTKATGTIGMAYATIEDKNYGKPGNLINFKVTQKQAETLPTTGSFAWMIPTQDTDMSHRIDGGAEFLHGITAGTPPNGFTAFLTGNGIDTAGGTDLANMTSVSITHDAADNVVAGTKTFHFANATFTTADVGKAIKIAGASNAGNNHSFIISSRVSATDVVCTTATGLVDETFGGGVTQVLLAPGTLALTVVSFNRVQIDSNIALRGTTPTAGGTLFIPTTSVLASVHANNAGSYIVISATSAQIIAIKLLDATGALNALTAPTTQAALPVEADDDIQSFAAITLTRTAGVPVKGIGKSIEINDTLTDTGAAVNNLYYLVSGVPTPVTWLSQEGAPKVINAGAEYIANVVVSRQVDSITETLSAGGGIALLIGYEGTTASMVNDGTSLVLTLVGGDSSGLSPITITLADFPTIADLAQYIGSLAGFVCAPGTAVIGSQPSTSLDHGTFTFGSNWGGYTGRIKQDAYKIFTNFATSSVLTELAAQPDAGQPDVQALSFLSGGTLGATTDSIYADAMEALKLVRGNFVIPLFSRDATDDIADGLTDPASSYTVDGVIANTLAHILQMRTLKARRNRQGFVSFKGTFADGQTKSANIASAYMSFSFEDIKDVATNGIKQFQPWMEAIKAAAGQAAAFYRPIFNKTLNISGALQAAGDYNPDNDSQTEDALHAGMLPIRRDETGGFHFVSDQTTYGKDNNFFYNSIQAVYVGDIIALTTANRMERAFVGQSIADVSRSLALTTLEGIMGDLLRLKLIAVSDDAPKGFKDADIQIRGPAMIVTIGVKLAGAIYFIPIQFAISQVQQSA